MKPVDFADAVPGSEPVPTDAPGAAPRSPAGRLMDVQVADLGRALLSLARSAVAALPGLPAALPASFPLPWQAVAMAVAVVAVYRAVAAPVTCAVQLAALALAAKYVMGR